jgi:hypothetical protein
VQHHQLPQTSPPARPLEGGGPPGLECAVPGGTGPQGLSVQSAAFSGLCVADAPQQERQEEGQCVQGVAPQGMAHGLDRQEEGVAPLTIHPEDGGG